MYHYFVSYTLFYLILLTTYALVSSKNRPLCSDDEDLKDIINVEARSGDSLVEGSELDPNKAVQNGNDSIVGSANSAGEDGDDLALQFVILIASAFAVTFGIIGLLTYRKYQRYQQNNRNNDYRSYQNRKRKITINTNAKALKQYNQFESPEGSAISQSEDHICDDLEIAGGDTFPEHSDSDPTSPGKQFHPNDDENTPYDEPNTPSAYDMTYFAHSANLMMDHSRIDDETLEGLYSDKDSYFQSTIGAPSVTGQHRRGDSIHSLDTLNNTFGTENNPVHLIDGIDAIASRLEGHHVEYPTPPSNDQLDESTNIGDITVTESSDMMENNVVIDDTNVNEQQEDSTTVSVQPALTHEAMNMNDDILQRRADNDEPVHQSDTEGVVPVKSGDSMEHNTVFESPNNTEISTTDELYARITELENRIMSTESRLAEDEIIPKTPTPTAADLVPPPPPPLPYSNQGTLETASPDRSIQTGFTDETLGMIEQTRLSGTPPPSEGEVDSEMINKAKENPLLGKFLDQSDSEEDTIFSQEKSFDDRV